MKDEEAIDWKEGFPILPLDKKNKFNEGSWKALGKKVLAYLVFFFLGRGGE
jgi:hypothetical protein